MKAKSLITILLGSLILVITGHNIIPHHHHLDDVHSHTGCHQHDADEHDGETEDPVTHCHGFNGIEYLPNLENQSGSQPVKWVLSICPVRFPQADTPPPQEFSKHHSRGPTRNFPGIPGKIPGLRAPPYMA